ncbi:hypothetical protein, partial [Neisseria meningitidis]|uniref:hypothetical protein n=1 Tax=Neisseria meningitidis TaxID=487 RepID=UPI001EE851EA
ASAAVIPAQAGIWNFNASRIYRKKTKPFRRHSHESGNLEMKSSRNLSEMTGTERTGFPLRRESRISMPQEFIGKKQNPSAVIPTKVGI